MTSALETFKTNAYEYLAPKLDSCKDFVTKYLTIFGEKIADGHNWAKTVEKAGIGRHYTLASEKIDAYVMEPVVKPVFRTASNQISAHPYLALVGLAILIQLCRHATPTGGKKDTNDKN